jgi:hypothetical protein
MKLPRTLRETTDSSSKITLILKIHPVRKNYVSEVFKYICSSSWKRGSREIYLLWWMTGCAGSITVMLVQASEKRQCDIASCLVPPKVTPTFEKWRKHLILLQRREK